MNESEAAVAQAKSYALHPGLPSSVVAATEELWIYSLERNHETSRQRMLAHELPEQVGNARNPLLS